MKKGLRLPILTFSTAILLGALAARPALAGPAANDNELLLNAGFFHAQDSDFSNVNLDLSLGRFLNNPAWQIGLLQGLNWNIVDDAEDPWAATTAPFVRYHFLGPSQTNRIIPFLGAFFGAVWNDNDITGTLGPEAGLKFFVTEQAFIQTRYRYEWFFDEFESADDQSDNGNHVISVGIGYVWGGADSDRHG
jgi:hypothetical protein